MHRISRTQRDQTQGTGTGRPDQIQEMRIGEPIFKS